MALVRDGTVGRLTERIADLEGEVFGPDGSAYRLHQKLTGVEPLSSATVLAPGASTARTLAEIAGDVVSLAGDVESLQLVRQVLAVRFLATGDHASGAALGADGEPVGFTRASAATYGSGSALVTVAADRLRVEPRGALVERTTTNVIVRPNDLTRGASWVKRGAAAVAKDGTLAPDGKLLATLVSGIGAKGVDDAYQVVTSNLGAGARLPTTLWIKKVSASGTLSIQNAQSDVYGLLTVDLANLPAGWQRIGDAAVAGVVSSVAFKAHPTSGNGGIQVYSTAGAGLSFYLAHVQQEAGLYATSNAAHTYASVLASGDDLTTASWTKRGDATVTKDGTLGPDGVTQASLLQGIAAAGSHDVYQAPAVQPPGTTLVTTLWIKKVSESGVLQISNAAHVSTYGRYRIDLSLLPAGWVQIGAGLVAGVTVPTSWEDGGAGVQFSAESGGPLAFYAADVVQEAATPAARAAESLTVANPLPDGALSWSIAAGLWTLGAGPNSASMKIVGSDLVFSVTDATGATRTVTAALTEFPIGPRRIVGSNARGELSLYVDGMEYGAPGGSGLGIISQQPATLVVNESIGPMRGIRVSQSGDPASVGEPGTGALIVTFTFDDGTQNHADYAAPALEAHGMRGTFFVISGLLAQSYQGGPTMSAATVQALAAKGHEIGSHTRTHANLPTLSEADKRAEIMGSRVDLTALGLDVRTLAYPWGENDAATRAIVEEAGYSAARVVSPPLSNASGYGGSAPFGVTEAYVESVPPRDGWMSTRRAYVDGSTAFTLTDFKNTVLDAELHLPARNGRPGVLTFMMHHVAPAAELPASQYVFPSEDFTAFLDWLQPRAARGTVVQTFGEAMQAVAKPTVWP